MTFNSILHLVFTSSVIWSDMLSNVPTFYLTFDICSHTCSNMLFGILFNIYYVILSYTLCDKYSVMLSYISCDTYSVILSDLFISHMFWQPIWRFISRKCWHATWHLEFYLTYILKIYLTSFLPEAWDPCQPQTQTPSLIKHVEKSQNMCCNSWAGWTSRNPTCFRMISCKHWFIKSPCPIAYRWISHFRIAIHVPYLITNLANRCIIYIYIQCGAPAIAKLVHNSNFTMVYGTQITIVFMGWI